MLPKRQHLSFSPSYINTLVFTSSAAPRRVGGEQSAAIWAVPASGGGPRIPTRGAAPAAGPRTHAASRRPRARTRPRKEFSSLGARARQATKRRGRHSKHAYEPAQFSG